MKRSIQEKQEYPREDKETSRRRNKGNLERLCRRYQSTPKSKEGVNFFLVQRSEKRACPCRDEKPVVELVLGPMARFPHLLELHVPIRPPPRLLLAAKAREEPGDGVTLPWGQALVRQYG
jgi:hypothetical protein